MPSVIYPDYEGPSYSPETPYTITFTEKQSLCEYTHNPHPQLVSDLSYIFSSKAERDRIRSILFGKRLLLHAGVQSIKFDYIACELEAVSLWEEDATSKPLTITFNRNSSASRSHPHGEVEYEIVVLVSYRNHLKANKPLKLRVRQVAGPGLRERASEEKDCRLFFSRSDEKAAFISILKPPQP